MSTINLTVYIDGVLTNTDSTPVLENSTDTYGVRDTDDNSVIVSSGTAMTSDGTGRYSHTYTDTSGTIHEYSFKIVHNSVTYYRTFISPIGTMNNVSILTKDSPIYYTSQAEVYRKLGPIASELHEDDIDESERAFLWRELLEEVTDNIDFRTSAYYPRSELLNNNWVRRKATILGAAALSTRRGQATLFSDLVTRVYDELEEIGTNVNGVYIPGATPLGSNAPAVRNYEVNTFRGWHPLRVRSTVSTGETYPGEDIAYEPFWF